MSYPHALLTMPDGQTVEALPGDIVGRSARADIRVNDPRVSEARALISLRERRLLFLRLRDPPFRCDGKKVSDFELRAGQTIELAPGVALRVLRVALPATTRAAFFTPEGGPPIAATPRRGALSLLAGPPPQVERGYVDGAAAHLWKTGSEIYVQRAGEPPRPLRPGAAVAVAGGALSARDTSTGAVHGASPTSGTQFAPQDAIEIEVVRTPRGRARAIRVRRGDRVAHITRIIQVQVMEILIAAHAEGAARLPDEPLATAVNSADGGAEIWGAPGEEPRGAGADQIEVNWRNHVRRIRDTLKARDIRTDLVCALGQQRYALRLRSGDRLIDAALTPPSA